MSPQVSSGPSCKGFSLVELLVVMTIISILTAIAIPQYNDYKKRAFDLRAQTDLQNIATAEEAYFMDHERYLSCTGAACAVLPGIKSLSKDVILSVEASEADFTAQASHPKGTGKVFVWQSSAGGMK